MKKRGISPVVATTLLVAMVIVIALIVFLWLRGVVGDYGEKFGKNIELVCEEVQLDASYSGGMLYITNDGNVPVFKINLKIVSEGSHVTDELNNVVEGWPSTGLNLGGVFAGDISSSVSGAEKITLFPILIGTSDKGGKKTYTCDEQYGYELIL